MGSKHNRRLREAERVLRRDEIAAPDFGGLFGEWNRDVGYILNRLIRRMGPLAPVVAIVAIIGILVGLVLRFI
ncbi:MAG: hypothetical protein Q7U75_14935 [Desulfobacterales bacterium]|nr:hypothetical protein [Desulfobacterales bacterium]